MKTLAKLEKRIDIWFLLIASFVFFLLRLPSLFEPYWYGDEGIYEVVGAALRAGRQLYTGIWDNKPPLLYIFYALFGSDQFGIRFMSLLFGIAAMIVFFYLSKKLFQSEKISIVTTALFTALFATPLIEGNIANAENFMLVLIISAAILVYQTSSTATKAKSPGRSSIILFVAGILLSIAFLFKIVAVFDFAAFFLFLLFLQIPKNISDTKQHYLQHLRIFIKQTTPYVLGFLLPISITIIFFLITGAFSEFIHATFFSNISYVGYNNTFLFPQGLLVLKLLLLGGFMTFVLWKRALFTKGTMFLLVWSAFSLFNLFFSQRPYTHYMLVFLPCFCLCVGFIFVGQRMRLVLISLLIITIVLIKTHFDFYSNKKEATYYQNFIAYIFGQKNTEDYQAFFDKKTPRDYQIASYLHLHTHPGDIVLIWGNSAQIYALSGTLPPGRYTVAYHMQDQKPRNETAEYLQKLKPAYIVTLADVAPIPFDMQAYTTKTTLLDNIIYERTN